MCDLLDTRSYLDALRHVPRQPPDLLMIHALRSAEMLESAPARRSRDARNSCILPAFAPAPGA